MQSATVSSSAPSDASIKKIDALLSGATPQFAMQLKARVYDLVAELPESDDIRKYGETQMDMLDRLAMGTTRGIRTAGRAPITDEGWKSIPSHP